MQACAKYRVLWALSALSDRPWTSLWSECSQEGELRASLEGPSLIMKQRMINWNRPGVGGLERGAKLSEIWTGNKDGKQLLLLLPVSLILSHLGCMASVLIEGLLASSTAESFSSFISRLFGNFTLTGVCSPHLVVVLAHFSHPGASL